MSEIAQSCENCRYLSPSGETDNFGKLACRRFPSYWGTHKTAWCGEWGNWRRSVIGGTERDYVEWERQQLGKELPEDKSWPSFIPKPKLKPKKETKQKTEYGYVDGPNDDVPFAAPLSSSPSDVWQDEDRTTTNVERVYETRYDCGAVPGGARLIRRSI